MKSCDNCRNMKKCSVINRVREMPCIDYRELKKNKKIALPPTKAKCYQPKIHKGISNPYSNRK